MITLDRMRQQGFTLRPVAEGLYIDPIDELSDVQRQWVISNKPQILQQLLTERWQWFLSLAAKQCIHADVVGREFPTQQDRLDVVEPTEHDDKTLRLCMATLCRDTRVMRRQSDYSLGRWVPAEPNGELAL